MTKLSKLFIGILQLSIALGTFIKTQGQAGADFFSIPNAIPPPPNAASLGKFGDIPVGLYTGIPSTSIPLHTVNAGGFSMPISLDYHSAGLKVEEQASLVGLGWALNAGGMITRTVHGKPDERGDGYWVNGLLADEQIVGEPTYVNNPIWVGGLDIEPDMFYYNFCGRSGKFVLDLTPAHNGHCIPYQNLKITTTGLGSFTILDENGITYIFDLKEQTTSEPYIYTSSWYLTKIITPAGTITLTYSSTFEQYSTYQISLIDYTKQIGITNILTGPGSGASEALILSRVLQQIDAPDQSIQFYVSRDRRDIPGCSILDSVTVKDLTGIAKKRYAFVHSYFGKLSSTKATDVRLKLDTVIENSCSDQQQKRYALDYYSPDKVPGTDSKSQDYWGYFNGKPNTTLLLAVNPLDYPQIASPILGADRSTNFNSMVSGTLQAITYPTGGKSTFVYEGNDYGFVSGVPIDDTEHIPNSTTAIATRTGGNNIPSNTQTFTIASTQTVQLQLIGSYTGPVPVDDGPTVILNQINTDGSRKNIILQGMPNTSQIKYVALFPGNYEIIAKVDGTGQKAEIDINFYSLGNPIKVKACGGVRIKQIINTDPITGKSNIKNFSYRMKDDPARSSGNINSEYNFLDFVYGYLIRSSYSASYLALTQGSAVGYQLVTEAESTDNTKPIGWKESYFATYPSNLNAAIFKLYTNNFQDPPQFEPAGGTKKQVTDYDVFRGLLLKEDVYNNQSVLIKETLHNYNQDAALLPTSPNYFELTVRRGSILFVCQNGCSSCGGVASCAGTNFFPLLTKSKILCPWIYKMSDITTTYDQNGQNPITETINYYYDNPAHGLVTRTQTQNSRGETLKIIKSYPGDKSQITGLDPVSSSVLDTMVNRNMIAPVVQEEHYNDNNLVARLRTDFAIWDNPRRNIAPAKTWYQVGSNPIEARLNYISYDDNNNPTQIAKVNDINNSYIWDYVGRYPIAQVKNADNNSIAYTSFEADGTGNWTIGNGYLDPNIAITGTSAYVLNGIISKSNLNSSTTYIVSYWTQNGSSMSIPGTIAGYPTRGKTIRGWTLYVHKVTGQSTISVNGTGHIDELRLYPATAQMTTYTYLPLTGMSSACDVGNRVTYYEYDGFQRLKRIRDEDQNILKTYDYQYQYAGCGTNCYAVPMQTLAGTNTLGYPVGVFSVQGKLLGNVSGPADYVNLWNSDADDAALGTLSTGSDALHFNMLLNAGKTLPAGVTGCRYYQYDLSWNQLDAARNFNAAYIDFGDGAGMRMGKTPTDTPSVIAPNTTYRAGSDGAVFPSYSLSLYYVHTYPDASQKTITFYHNDANETAGLDNVTSPASSLSKIQNLRGNLPQNTTFVGGSSYQQASANTVANITNWNSIQSVTAFTLNTGDGGKTVHANLNFTQDFMQNNRSLQLIWLGNNYYYAGYYDPSFKISTLKSDWNTYFTKLQAISMTDDQWNREDLSNLKALRWFEFAAANQLHSNISTSNPVVPLPASVIDNILNQIAAGSGQTVTKGTIVILAGGTLRTSASDAAVNLLKSKNWRIYINGIQL